jgi:hypothetical protein
MNVVDAAVLTLLALADLALIIQLRRARGRRVREERVMRSLRHLVQRVDYREAPAPPVKPWTLRSAS